MGLESGTYISDLVTTNPAEGDNVGTTNDHFWLVKNTIKNTFPNVSGAISATHTQLSYVTGVTSAIQTQLDAKAALASPALTGTPTAPTAASGTSTTQIATTAFVAGGVSGDFILIKDTTISGTPTTVDFINGSGGVVLNSTYDEYLITFSSVVPTTNGVNLLMRTSTNASTFDSTANDYGYAAQQLNAVGTLTSVTAGQASGATSIQLAASILNTANTGVSGYLVLWKPATEFAKMYFALTAMDGAVNSSLATITGSALRYANDVDGIRFLLSGGGTFAAGRIKLFGRKL